MKKVEIARQIIEVAQNLIQSKGYNAFSYRDIAAIVGIKTSSIHYHFPTKADLGKAVVQQHIVELTEHLTDLMERKKLSHGRRLDLFFESIFSMTYLSERKMCLGGMLASDVLTLPEIVQYEVRNFFTKIEEWLRNILSQGLKEGEFHLQGSVKAEANITLAILEGALLLARLYKDEGRLVQARKLVMKRLLKT